MPFQMTRWYCRLADGTIDLYLDRLLFVALPQDVQVDFVVLKSVMDVPLLD